MPVKDQAQCALCGRVTSVRRDGTLHAHNNPGWRTRCPGKEPVRRKRKALKGEATLW